MENIKGRVYDLKTGCAIENVSVTDGRNVVKTDKNGEYILPGWEKWNFVSVTQPSGYYCKDFYLKKDAEKTEYNFCMESSKIKRGSEHRFLQISDTEIGPNSNLDWIENVKKCIKKENPAFLIHTGDICYRYGLKNHIKLVNTETMECPTYYVIGNHDYVEGGYGEELYESIYGPVWYSFEFGNVHYAVTPIHYGDAQSKYNPYDRWIWLENDLMNTDPCMDIVIFNHTKSPTQDYVLPLKFNEMDLKKTNLRAWIFGHYHYNYIDEKYGVKNISTARPDCGGIDSSASGMRLISVEKDSVKAKMLYTGYENFTEPQDCVWSKKLLGNSLFCDTVLADNLLYTATGCDDSPCECGVYCLDSHSAEIKWFYRTLNSIKNNVIVQNEKLIAMDTEGRVYCLNRLSGNLIWQQQVGVGEALGTSSAITISGENVIAGCSQEVTALDINNGNVKWSSNIERGENSPAEFVVCDDKLLVNAHWGALICLNASTGRENWANSDSDVRFRSSTPCFLSKKHILLADAKSICIIDADNGMLESKKTFPEIDFSSSAKPFIYEGTAYIATVNRGVIGYDIENKKIVSEFSVGENELFTAPYSNPGSRTVESSPVVFKDVLYFGASDGFIYAYDTVSQKLKGKYNCGSPVLGKIALSRDKIFACGFKGYAAAFKI